MIESRDQLFEAITTVGFPTNLLKIWEDDVPKRLRFTLQSPASLFESFLAHPDGFPSPEELLILWQTNGESIVGYLQSSDVFIRNYLEDGPEEFEILGASYQQILGDLFANLIMRETTDAELQECEEFLNFEHLPQLKEFVATNRNWEGNTATFIAEIESQR